MIARSFLSLSLDFSMLRQNQFSGENILKTFCEIPENWQHSGSHVAYVRAGGKTGMIVTVCYVLTIEMSSLE